MTRGTSKKGPQKKKAQAPTHSLRPWTAMLTHFFSGATFPAGPGWGFVFLLRPRADAHSLTAGLGGDASRRGGLFFFAAAPPGPVCVCFCFLAVAPPGRSLTHCGLGRFRQGPGGDFFGPRTRRANNKKCLVDYIGRVATAKKDTTSGSEIQSIGHKKRMLAAQGTMLQLA